MKQFRSAELMQLSYKGYFKAMGYSEDELSDKKPRIGIANSWNQLVPGHYNLNQVAEYVKRGIYAAGGTACEFGVMHKSALRQILYRNARDINGILYFCMHNIYNIYIFFSKKGI